MPSLLVVILTSIIFSSFYPKMVPNNFHSLIDALSQHYEILYSENKSLRRDNKRLLDQNVHYASQLKYYTSKLKKKRLLKLGSDWAIKGDHIADISLMKVLNMPCAISNAVLNQCASMLAFGCNHQPFVVIKELIYIPNAVSEKVELLSPSFFDSMVFLEKSFVCMGFVSNDQLYTVDSYLRLWDLKNLTLVGKTQISKVYGLTVHKEAVYLLTDGKVKIYKDVKLVKSLKFSNEEFSGSLCVDDKFIYALVKRDKIAIFDIERETFNLVETSDERLLALCVNKLIYVGGYGKSVYAYKGTSLVETECYENIILALDCISGVQIMALQDGSLLFKKEKSSMKIVLKEGKEGNFINISVGNGYISTVDTIGTCRIWKFSSVK